MTCIQKKPKISIKKLLELIKKFNGVVGYKLNMQKPTVFQYISNEKSESESKNTIQLTITSKRIKYLGINLTKEV